VAGTFGIGIVSANDDNCHCADRGVCYEVSNAVAAGIVEEGY